MLFRDRTEAGQQLAQELSAYADKPDVLVLALPRGGVPVAYEVARTLHAPLDILVVRKLGVPGQEELAMGAIASGGVYLLNRAVVELENISEQTLREVARRELKEIERRNQLYRGDRPLPIIKDRTVIMVDDGLATGSTMHAAVRVLRRQSPKRLVVAVPVGAEQTCGQFRDEVDEIVCAETPRPFMAVGLWYEDFSQTTDEQVRDLLHKAWEHGAAIYQAAAQR
jgi:putative phosphoribosyl transferase